MFSWKHTFSFDRRFFVWFGFLFLSFCRLLLQSLDPFGYEFHSLLQGWMNQLHVLIEFSLTFCYFEFYRFKGIFFLFWLLVTKTHLSFLIEINWHGIVNWKYMFFVTFKKLAFEFQKLFRKYSWIQTSRISSWVTQNWE